MALALLEVESMLTRNHRLALAIAVCASVSSARRADAIPQGQLFGVDLHVGFGLGLGGAHGHTVMRQAPYTLGLTGSLAINEEPNISLFGGLYMEGVDRFGLGLQFGARVRPLGYKSGMRLAASVIGMVVPYTIFGVTLEGGYCAKVEKKDRVRPCVDVQGVVFFVGNDLPKGEVAAQLNILLGAHFNAL